MKLLDKEDTEHIDFIKVPQIFYLFFKMEERPNMVTVINDTQGALFVAPSVLSVSSLFP